MNKNFKYYMIGIFIMLALIFFCAAFLIITTPQAQAESQEKSISITTLGGDFLVYHGSVTTEKNDFMEVVDAWLVGYELSESGTYMNEGTADMLIEELDSAANILRQTESSGESIADALLEIEFVISILENSKVSQNAST